jgi:hypothetical protein
VTPEQAVFEHLAGDSAVRALAGDRLYPERLPQKATFPALTYTRISNLTSLTQDGPTGSERPRVEIDAWAETYGAAVTLAEAVKSALHGRAWTASDGTVVELVELDTDRDDPVPDPVLRRRIADYFVHVKPAS